MPWLNPCPLAAALLASALSGCVGLILETSADEDIQNPVPHQAKSIMLSTTDRWACRPPHLSAPSASKQDFLSAWGEPAEKSADGARETWRYEDRRRWCGFIVLALVPVPVMLPLCNTHDRVEFEGDAAVRSTSRRLVASGAGIIFHPHSMVPVPFWFGSGGSTDGAPILRDKSTPCPAAGTWKSAESAAGFADPDQLIVRGSR